MQQVGDIFLNAFIFSIRAYSSKIQLSRTKVHLIFLNCLLLLCYKLQNIQALTKSDNQERLEFTEHCCTLVECFLEDLSKQFLKRMQDSHEQCHQQGKHNYLGI